MKEEVLFAGVIVLIAIVMGGSIKAFETSTLAGLATLTIGSFAPLTLVLVSAKGILQQSLDKAGATFKPSRQMTFWERWRLRLAAIERILYIMANGIPLNNKYKSELKKAGDDPVKVMEVHKKIAPEMDKLIEKLKGAWVKAAQAVAGSEETPEPYLEVCRKYLTYCPSEPVDVIIKTIERSLGQKHSEIFSSFESIPIGTGSIGQVHKAVLKKNGKTVVVKVRLPDAIRNFLVDHFVFRIWLNSVDTSKNKFWSKWMDDAEDHLVNEMDYNVERKALEDIRKFMMKRYDEYMVVPESYPEYCSTEVLVMEHLEGERLIDAADRWMGELAKNQGMEKEKFKAECKEQWNEQAKQEQGQKGEGNFSPIEFLLQSWKYNLGLALSGIDMGNLDVPKVMGPLVEAHGFQLLMKGVFNGDPHGGNVLLLEDGRIGLIDFGGVRRVDKKDRVKFAKMVVSIVEDDGTPAAQSRVAKNASAIWTIEKPDDFAQYYRAKGAFGVLSAEDYAMFAKSDGSFDNWYHKQNQNNPLETASIDFMYVFRMIWCLKAIGQTLNWPCRPVYAWYAMAEQVLRDAKDDEAKPLGWLEGVIADLGFTGEMADDE